MALSCRSGWRRRGRSVRAAPAPWASCSAQHEHRVAFHFGGGRALQQTLQKRDGAVGVALHEPVDGHQLEFFIVSASGATFWPDACFSSVSSALASSSQRLEAWTCAARRWPRRLRRAGPACPARMPSSRGAIHPRTVERDHLAEVPHGLIPVAVVERALPGRIEAIVAHAAAIGDCLGRHRRYRWTGSDSLRREGERAPEHVCGGRHVEACP